MKKKLILLLMLVSFLALSFTFLSCEEPALELSGTKWVYGLTKAELAAEMETTEAAIDQMLTLTGVTINWPVPVMQIAFTSGKDFTLSQNTGFSSLFTNNTLTWEVVLSGTYTISGNDVTLTVSGSAPETTTVNGNTLTLTSEDEDGEITIMKFRKQ